MRRKYFGFKKLNSPLSLILVLFVLLAIPVTVFTVLKSEETSKNPEAATPAVPGFVEQGVVSGLTKTVAMEFSPDGRLFVAEQCGNLRVVKNGSLLSQPYLTVSNLDCAGERGLLGVAFDPNWNSNKYIYVYHTVASPLHNRISRFTQSPTNSDIVDSSSQTTILDLDSLSGATNHNGGAIHFGKDGKLYVAVGENATKSNAQSLSNRHGKLLRINSDGSIPSDNPTTFQALSGTTSGANRAIWAVGLRNPFTFAIQPGSGKIYINNVGANPPPDTPNSAGPFESVYNGAAGANYGWPNAEGNQSCSTYTCPVYTYDHGGGRCAITGGDFYNPTTVKYPTDYVGNYFFADYCAGWIKRMNQNNSNAITDFVTGVSRPVDLKTSPDGELYILNRVSDTNNAGKITKIVFATPTHTDPEAGSTNIWCEGESANPLTPPMAVGTDSSVSQSYVYTTATDVTSSTLPTNTGTAEYNFDVPTTGLYTFLARVNYPDASSNSFWLQFDNNQPINKIGNDNNFNSWHWINYSDGDTTPVTLRINLTEGTHKLKVVGREPNAKLDRWVLSTDSLFYPLDSNRGPAANCAVATNQIPTATINTPTASTTYTHGQTISFSAAATDPEDGTLPASAFSWNIEFGHSTHFHPHQTFNGIKSGSFIANFGESADNVYYRLSLTVTDSGGKQTTVYRDVLPVKSTIGVSTNPTSMQIKLDDVPNTSPISFVGVVGYPRVLEAVSPQTKSGKTYQFVSWSDGGARVHSVSTPAANTTYLATFQEIVKQGDANGDGNVNSGDLAILISTWGSSTDFRADLNSDGKVNSTDLAILISKWGS